MKSSLQLSERSFHILDHPIKQFPEKYSIGALHQTTSIGCEPDLHVNATLHHRISVRHPIIAGDPTLNFYFQLNFYRFNFPRGQDGKVKDLGSVLQLLDKLLIFRSEVLEINSFESFSDIVQALFDLQDVQSKSTDLIGRLIRNLVMYHRPELIDRNILEHGET